MAKGLILKLCLHTKHIGFFRQRGFGDGIDENYGRGVKAPYSAATIVTSLVANKYLVLLIKNLHSYSVRMNLV